MPPSVNTPEFPRSHTQYVVWDKLRDERCRDRGQVSEGRLIRCHRANVDFTDSDEAAYLIVEAALFCILFGRRAALPLLLLLFGLQLLIIRTERFPLRSVRLLELTRCASRVIVVLVWLYSACFDSSASAPPIRSLLLASFLLAPVLLSVRLASARPFRSL
jgi:hypothetical protein